MECSDGRFSRKVLTVRDISYIGQVSCGGCVIRTVASGEEWRLRLRTWWPFASPWGPCDGSHGEAVCNNWSETSPRHNSLKHLYMGLWTQRENVVCKVRRSGPSFTRLHVVTDMPIEYARICILWQQQLVFKGPGCKAAACFKICPRFLL